MSKHKPFSFDKFTSAVKDDLLKSFLAEEGVAVAEGKDLTPSYVSKQLDALNDKNKKLDIMECMHSINDIADHTMEALIQVVNKHELKCEEDETPESTAMRVYLFQRLEFEIIHDQFLMELYAENMNHFSFENCGAAFDLEKIGQFRQRVEQYYRDRGKSENCVIRERSDNDKHCFFIARGDYMKTQTIFEDKQLKYTSFRPGKEDMLLFDKVKSVLSIKSSGRGLEERHTYIDLFGTTILGLKEIPQETYEKTLVVVNPVREQLFYGGNKDISTVKLVQVSLRQISNPRVKMILKSDDVFQTLDDMELSLNDFNLLSAKLKFFFHENRRPVTVEINPPGNTKIKKRREKEIIENYLREKHVLLV
ncbi:MAG: hypothetical protein KKH94_07200 [Candidatus Omnitrophica bacterium]|nr:hypothetical protein [Candidatus Omnitrophota bacterium]